MRIAPLALAATLAFATAACGSGGEATSPTATTTTTTAAADAPDLSAATFSDQTDKPKVEVDAVDNTFQAQYVTVKAGTTITFKNAGHNEHNVVAVDDGFAGRATDKFEPGTSYTVTFDKAGDYPYYCSLHGTTTKGMTGAIRVVS